jgi:hypothetical protein
MVGVEQQVAGAGRRLTYTYRKHKDFIGTARSLDGSARRISNSDYSRQQRSHRP